MVIHLHRAKGLHTSGVRDGLRAGRAAPFCGRAALTAVRRRHSCQPAALEEVRRIGQGPKGFENTGGPVTLAYVFAHRPAPGLPAGAYEDALRRFHAALATGRTPGFIGSTTYRIGDGYADWYLVESSAALDSLNDAAVSGLRAPAHDAAAKMAANGTGKLLRLATGEPDLVARHEVRFAKPAGVAYSDLYETLDQWTPPPGVSLWRRVIGLGPPPQRLPVPSLPLARPPREGAVGLDPSPHLRP